jgi:hypothetical protein
MGQQQLLLIVLGVIIVGIAVVVGINLFNANSETSTQDTMVSEATNLGAMAQQFYKKPTAMGGGGNAFDKTNGAPAAWTIPSAMVLDASGNTFAATVSAQSVTITGTPNTNDKYTWKVYTTVSPTSIVSTVK